MSLQLCEGIHLRVDIPEIALLMADSLKTCGSCRRTLEKKTLCCSGCSREFYCNVECQRAHWKVHKSTCKSSAAAKFSRFMSEAVAGDVEAFGKVGMCYDLGVGVAINPSEAVRWFRKGADAGVSSSQFTLGSYYRDGVGVAQDSKEALRWFRLAAAAGNATAQTTLGCCYLQGALGVAMDEAEAVRWFVLAAKGGDETAQRALRLLGGE